MAKAISIKVENLDAVIAALAKVGGNAQNDIGREVQAQALTMISNVKRQIQKGPKTGRYYRRKGSTHRASAPYEAPPHMGA